MEQDVSKEKVFIYNRESFLGAVLSDCVTFGFLIGLMFLNFNYWGGHWYTTIFILIIWLTYIAARGSKRIHIFYSAEECIKFIQEESK